MAIWSNTYREQAIPGPNPSGTITEHRPGQKLAKVVTEIQEKVPNAVRSELGEGMVDEGTAIEGGDLVLRLALEQDSENLEELLTGANESIQVVTGGTWPNLQTKTLTVENGLIKEAPDGDDVQYPELPLYDGFLIVLRSAGFAGNRFIATQYQYRIEQGLIKEIATIEAIEQTLDFVQKPSDDPIDATVEVVVDIFYDSEEKALKKSIKKYRFQNGLLVEVTDEPDQVLLNFAEFSC